MTARSAPVPSNVFGVAFGSTALAGAWTCSSDALHLSILIPDVFWVIVVITWSTTLVRHVLVHPLVQAVTTDLHRPVLDPFAVPVPLVATVLGGRVHAGFAHLGTARVLATTTVSFLLGCGTGAMSVPTTWAPACDTWLRSPLRSISTRLWSSCWTIPHCIAPLRRRLSR